MKVPQAFLSSLIQYFEEMEQERYIRQSVETFIAGIKELANE